MSLIIFLTVVQAVIAAMLVGVILMQQSEGGGLGVGGSPTGLMSARGAANFMTRMTTILAILFVALSIVLAALAARESGERSLEGVSGDAAVQQPTVPAAPAPDATPATTQSQGATPASNGLAPLTLPAKKQ